MSGIIIWFNRKSLGEGCQLLKCFYSFAQGISFIIVLMVPLSCNSQSPPTHAYNGLDHRTNLVLANISKVLENKGPKKVRF